MVALVVFVNGHNFTNEVEDIPISFINIIQVGLFRWNQCTKARECSRLKTCLSKRLHDRNRCRRPRVYLCRLFCVTFSQHTLSHLTADTPGNALSHLTAHTKLESSASTIPLGCGARVATLATVSLDEYE